MTTKFIFPCFLILSFQASYSQTVTSKLKFDQGQVFHIELDIKTTIAQQAMGQSIDFNVDATALHTFKVTNTTEDNTTLHHEVNKIGFSFDGMGTKMKFDSDKEKDMNGQFGKSIKDLLEKKYDIIIDTGGTVMMAMPETVKIDDKDSRMAIVMSMLKDVTELVQPPKKGNPCFFKFLPDKVTAKGESWTITSDLNGVKKQGSYKLSEINDSTVVVDFVENSVTISKATMMGSETTTTMNNKSTGKITLDKVTGIIKEKTSSTESNGTTVGAFGNVPVTSKTTVTIKVNH